MRDEERREEVMIHSAFTVLGVVMLRILVEFYTVLFFLKHPTFTVIWGIAESNILLTVLQLWA